jgi:hypothetical protein
VRLRGLHSGALRSLGRHAALLQLKS